MNTLAYIGRARRKGHLLTDEALVAEWMAVERRKRHDEAPLEAAARRLFRDQEQAVLERLEDELGHLVETKQLEAIRRLFDIERWRVTTGNLFAPLLARVFRSGFLAGGERVSVTGDLTSSDEEVLAFLQTLVAKTRDITDTTARDLARVVQEGLTEGDTMPRLRRRISDLFEQYRGDRADLIAQTSGVSAFERGQQLAFQRAGVEEKAWLSRRDGRVRMPPGSRFDHASADGQRVPVASPFVVSGESLMHPGDFTLGASAGNTIRCRCTSLPIML